MKNITEKNKLIAEFMGLGKAEPYYIEDENNQETNLVFSPDLKYNSDWNWLMEVIKEIGNKTDFELVMGYDYCYWNNEGEQPLEGFEGGYGDITYIYSAVISFIKWYNENK